MKRYQIITKSIYEGIDEKKDFQYLLDAHKAAKSYLREGYDSVFIYDKKENCCAYAYRGTPEGIFSADIKIRDTVIFWNPKLS